MEGDALPPTIPRVLLVRVERGGGPYAAGDRLALAYNDPQVGRIAAPARDEEDDRAAPSQALAIPAAVSVVVTTAAAPYRAGDELSLWFVDPRFARIQVMGDSGRAPTPPPHAQPEAEPRPLPPAPAAQAAAAAPAPAVVRGSATAAASGIASVRLHWGGDRVRRFVQVVDRLFTVDRLGWYRHALAMRLLVPDEIRCGDDSLDAQAEPHVRALRDAAVATLGGPLLEAFMPNFGITPQWLDALDVPAGARALAELRQILESAGPDGALVSEAPLDPVSTVGTIAAAELSATCDASAEATLPLFIACRSTFPEVSDRLADYRRALLELFGQTARSPKLVRLTQMAEPCHALDDRLFHLAGTIGEAFGGLSPS